MESKRKAFRFLKEERKCSPRLNKWTFTTCKLIEWHNMHVPGSRLGNYRTRWTFYWLSPQEFSDGWKEKWVDSAESYRRVFNTILPHFHMHIYRFCSW